QAYAPAQARAKAPFVEGLRGRVDDHRRRVDALARAEPDPGRPAIFDDDLGDLAAGSDLDAELERQPLERLGQPVHAADHPPDSDPLDVSDQVEGRGRAKR